MLVINLFFLYALSELCGAQECLSRDYGNDGTVCVCTADHCDIIPRPTKVEQPQYLKYTSNKKGLRFNLQTGTFGETDVRNNSFTVDPDQQFQTILGWGGAFTDSTGINIASLEEDLQEHLLNSYFSDVGIEYSLCRVPIGGTDFSTHGYSYDDGDVDTELENFELAPEDFQYKIPYIKKALNLTDGNLRFFASAWTAPKWMKTNGEYAGYGFLINSMYQSWADYFLKFLDSYKEEGIEFWGITTGNEAYPVNADENENPPINGVKWNSTDMVSWISNNLGPTLRNSSHSGINIMTFDDQRLWLFFYLDEIMSDETVRQYVDGIALHWYFDTYIPAFMLSFTHENYPEMFLLATEACNGAVAGEEHVLLGSWERGEKYSTDIIEDISHWMGGWVDWNMALDLQGGPTYIDNFVDSPIIVNSTAGEFYKQPMYYHLGHFSKFVPRDSTRIFLNSTSIDSQVSAVAFQTPDDGIVIVILNKNDEVVPITIADNTRGVAELELSERSITTFLYW